MLGAWFGVAVVATAIHEYWYDPVVAETTTAQPRRSAEATGSSAWSWDPVVTEPHGPQHDAIADPAVDPRWSAIDITLLEPGTWWGLENGPCLSPDAGECFRMLARHARRGCTRPYPLELLGSHWVVWESCDVRPAHSYRP